MAPGVRPTAPPQVRQRQHRAGLRHMQVQRRQETYHPATIQVFEQWCRRTEDLVVIPAAFGNTDANATVDDADLWLRPFGAQRVPSMSVPKPEPLQQALFGASAAIRRRRAVPRAVGRLL